MTEKRYSINIAVILGVSVLLMVFMYILVSHHRGIPIEVRANRTALMSTAGSVAERIKPVGEVMLASAEKQQEPAKAEAAAAAPSRDGKQVYQAICVACHDAGVAGAPKVGDKGQWAKRIAKGVNALYGSAVNGIQGSAGVMPAKGGNPTLSDAEVKAAVDYMVGRSK